MARASTVPKWLVYVLSLPVVDKRRALACSFGSLSVPLACRYLDTGKSSTLSAIVAISVHRVSTTTISRVPCSRGPGAPDLR